MGDMLQGVLLRSCRVEASEQGVAGAGGVVLVLIVAAVTAVSGFDPVARK